MRCCIEAPLCAGNQSLSADPLLPMLGAGQGVPGPGAHLCSSPGAAGGHCGVRAASEAGAGPAAAAAAAAAGARGWGRRRGAGAGKLLLLPLLLLPVPHHLHSSTPCLTFCRPFLVFVSHAVCAAVPAVLQLLAEHPELAAADSSKLMQLAAALGATQQQQPLLLRAAQMAHAAGDWRRSQSLLLLLAGQQFK